MTDTDLDEVGYAKVLHSFERGDYNDPAKLKAVKKWLRVKDKERDFLAACERASVSSALEAARAARRANIIAFLALVASAISARAELMILVRALLDSFGSR